ncbi:DUF4352 domain-containing protein [Gracilibacillus oryzae]|uniref:DUF4352 domain-containing protein n=1 Tax=Gracilibacillus oryzae TaxID=1672701 RepID=A0A7C8GQ78_9BACI|nr:DUF4352 domain-containing protein [Gracilibacillus oryzae]KAB8126017.1 DUF4352 domain-containing protein [Gracilibacillus oryzae]
MKCSNFLMILVIAGLLSACNNTKEISNEESNDIPAQENVIGNVPDMLHYGEGYKDGMKVVTLHTAYNDPKSVSAIISIENVGDTPLNADSLAFSLYDDTEDLTYQGTIAANKNPADRNLQPNDKITLNITFNIPILNDEYRLTVESFNSTDTTPWLVDDLKVEG